MGNMLAGKVVVVAVHLDGTFFVSRAAADHFRRQNAGAYVHMSQSRPVRSVHHDGGWTPQAIAEIAVPAMQKHFYPLERSPDVIGWDPI